MELDQQTLPADLASLFNKHLRRVKAEQCAVCGLIPENAHWDLYSLPCGHAAHTRCYEKYMIVLCDERSCTFLACPMCSTLVDSDGNSIHTECEKSVKRQLPPRTSHDVEDQNGENFDDAMALLDILAVRAMVQSALGPRRVSSGLRIADRTRAQTASQNIEQQMQLMRNDNSVLAVILSGL